MTGIALLENGNPEELEIITGSQAISGNVYLGKISKKVMLAGDKEGFFVNLGNGLEGFLNAEENGLSEVKLTEGQSIVVQVSQEKRAEKHARLVRSVQLAESARSCCATLFSVSCAFNAGAPKSRLHKSTVLYSFMRFIC